MAPAVPFIITALVSTAVSIGIAKMMQKNGDTDPNDIGANITKTGSTSPRNRVFGTCRASCTSVYSNVLDYDNEVRLDVFSIAGIGRLKYIHQAWIDEKQVLAEYKNISTDPNKALDGIFSGGTLSEKFKAQSVQIQFRNGSDVERALELAQFNSDGEWTEAMRGDRVPQVAVTAKRVIDKDGVVILGSNYNIVCEVTGGDCFDPRTGLKSPSNNPVLALYEVLTDKYYGMAIDPDYINTQSFIDAANWTDANKLHINGEINCNQSYNDILINILSCFSGSLIIEGGRVKILYEDVAPVLTHLNEDNYIRGTFDIIEASSSDYHNAVNISYKSFVNDEAEDQFQLPSNLMTDPTINEDGVLRTNEIKMPLTIDGRVTVGDGSTYVDGAVKFIANREYRRGKFKRQCSMDIDLLEFPRLTLFSVVTVSNKAHGWDKKKFRVSNIRSSVDDQRMSIASITLDEYADYIYTGVSDGVGGSVKPKLPKIIKSPIGIAFTQATFTTSGYGELSWTGVHYSQSLEYQIDYKLSNERDWTRRGETNAEKYKFSNLRPDKYDFRVRVLDRLFGTSAWTQLEGIRIDSNVNLPPVSGVKIDTATADFNISWDDMTKKSVSLGGGGVDISDPDNGGDDGLLSNRFAYYRVDIKHGSSGAKVLRSYFTTDNQFNYSIALNRANGISRWVTAEVYIVTVSDQVSNMGATSSKTAENPQHPEPRNLTCIGKIGAIWTEFEANYEPDFSGTEIHISKQSDFTPTEATLVTTLASETLNVWYFPEGSKKGDKRYVRVGHFDVFDRKNIKYSLPQLAPFHSVAADVPEFDPTDLEGKLEDLEKELEESNKELDRITEKVDENLPNINASLDKLRDPNNAPVNAKGERIDTRINLVASKDGAYTAGWALETNSVRASRFIVAADEFVVGGGKKTGGSATTDNKRIFYWDAANSQAYIENAAINNLDAKQLKSFSITSTQIKAGEITAGKLAVDSVEAKNIQTDAITANKIHSKAVVFGKVDANAIDANNIIAGSITGDRLKANTITGNKISAATTIIAGTGNTTAGMNGDDTNNALDYQGFRFWAGNPKAAFARYSVDSSGHLKALSAQIKGELECGNPENPPFKVDWNGNMKATSATIKGHVEATSGSFPAGLISGKIQASQIETKDFVLDGSTLMLDKVHFPNPISIGGGTTSIMHFGFNIGANIAPNIVLRLNAKVAGGALTNSKGGALSGTAILRINGHQIYSRALESKTSGGDRVCCSWHDGQCNSWCPSPVIPYVSTTIDEVAIAPRNLFNPGYNTAQVVYVISGTPTNRATISMSAVVLQGESV
ncbi:putative Fibronectin type-III domain-containing protein [Vibrio chagasii]|nr:putative Fibronectin type-III domain-containing protein [Vibrio chagasii]